ncbi:unnamed protein product [Toxocara canis]|uniref:DUF4154 domain-containing protein n=1 Tax=Toxocara canis TaxID=6265 RepID=A0A183V4Q6_TOXCA|nr:unnamed protein product [Toxocara canis]
MLNSAQRAELDQPRFVGRCSAPHTSAPPAAALQHIGDVNLNGIHINRLRAVVEWNAICVEVSTGRIQDALDVAERSELFLFGRSARHPY